MALTRLFERSTHPQERLGQLRLYLARSWPLYAMLAPALILLALFHYYPMYGLVIAFQRYNPGLGFTGSPWVGLANFERLFGQPEFWNVFRNTLTIAVGKIVTVQVVAIMLALQIHSLRWNPFKRTAQTLVYLPHFLSWVVLGGILIDLLALSLGSVLNAGFDQVLTIYNPAVYATGDIIDTYVYRIGLVSAQFSLAAAAGLIGSVLASA